MKVSKTDKIKRREAIIYKIVKHTLWDNDKYYIKHNKDSDTYYIGKEDKVIVIVCSNNKENINGKIRKRKNKEIIDKINHVGKNERKHKVSSQKEKKSRN